MLWLIATKINLAAHLIVRKFPVSADSSALLHKSRAIKSLQTADRPDMLDGVVQ